jgi:hypothetical protein
LHSLIDLRSDYFEFWTYVEVISLSEEGFSLFVDSLSYNYLIFEIWSHIVLRLDGKFDDDRRFPIFHQSLMSLRIRNGRCGIRECETVLGVHMSTPNVIIDQILS